MNIEVWGRAYGTLGYELGSTSLWGMRFEVWGHGFLRFFGVLAMRLL